MCTLTGRGASYLLGLHDEGFDGYACAFARPRRREVHLVQFVLLLVVGHRLHNTCAIGEQALVAGVCRGRAESSARPPVARASLRTENGPGGWRGRMGSGMARSSVCPQEGRSYRLLRRFDDGSPLMMCPLGWGLLRQLHAEPPALALAPRLRRGIGGRRGGLLLLDGHGLRRRLGVAGRAPGRRTRGRALDRRPAPLLLARCLRVLQPPSPHHM